jgi:hypothetical protein
MSLAGVVARFRNAGVPDWFYVTDGGLGTGECVGIEPVPGGWSVYCSERGGKSPLETCADEDAACRALLRRVDRMMRDSGRGGVPKSE